MSMSDDVGQTGEPRVGNKHAGMGRVSAHRRRKREGREVTSGASLTNYLANAKTSKVLVGKPGLTSIVWAIAQSSIEIARQIALGQLVEQKPLPKSRNADGDQQSAIDHAAETIILKSIRPHKVRGLISEES
jgi:hypothetical protein